MNVSSKQFVSVAEFKAKESKQKQESDLVKIGKQMRIMLKKIVDYRCGRSHYLWYSCQPWYHVHV